MPYADPEKQQAYNRARQERRKTDAIYIAQRRESWQRRYDTDPEFRAKHQAYQREYRKARRARDPEYRARTSEQNRRARIANQGIIWTPEQEAAFGLLTRCEVCGVESEKLHLDHCHDCGQYRGGLCSTCNTEEGVLRKWDAVCPSGSPMRVYLDRHVCEEDSRG